MFKNFFCSKLVSIGLLLYFVPIIDSLSADVTFSVNMHKKISKGSFAPGDPISVVINGNATNMSDADGDKIYTANTSGFGNENEITYNYRIIHSGITTNDVSRKYVVQPNNNANFVHNWFNNELPGYPYAKFFGSTAKAIPGEVVRFFEESEGGVADSWSWTFEGATPATSNSKTPTVVYSAPGTYKVNLTASNNLGNSIAKTLTITVTNVDQRLGWWNDQVFYHVYPRAFLDTDGNGTGDLRGIINKLDYLNDGNSSTSNDLGVTALYVMPVHPASNPEYGGYEITDYKVLFSNLGSQADFDELVAKAHARGMKVIMDFVFNHTSSEHTWFQQARQGTGSKYEQYYVFNNTNGPTPWGWRENTQSTNPNFKYWWSQFNGVFTADLNLRNSSPKNALKDVSSHWLGKGVDGFRIDAPIYFMGAEDGGSNVDRPETMAFVREWSAHIRGVKPDVFSVGESWFEGCYTGKTDALVSTAAKYVYQGFDIGFQFNIAYGIQDALNTENKSSITEPMEATMKYYPFLQFGVFHSNHDTYDMCANNYEQRRLKDRLLNNQDAKAKIGTAIVMTSPGVPFIYYGDEVGANGGTGYSARKPMQWNASSNAGFTTSSNAYDSPGPDYQTYNVASQTNDPNSFLSLHRNLIKVRLQEKALRRGDYKTVQTSSNGVYSFVRTYGNEVIFVILNLSSSVQSNIALSLSGTTIPSNTYTLSNLMNPTQTAASVNVAAGNISNWIPFASIPGNSFYILKLNTQNITINSQPTINAIADVIMNLENGAQSIALTGITDGNFCSQTVSTTATSSNNVVVSSPIVTYTSCNATGSINITPISAGTTQVIVTVKDNGGVANGGVDTKTIQFTVTVTDIPKAPTNLGLSLGNPSTSAKVNWTDNSTRETGFKIYWSETNVKPATSNATVGSNVNNYTVTGLKRFTNYYFWVEAYNVSGSSSFITGNMVISPPNLALNKPATASSNETFNGVNYLPLMAVDGINQSFTNRWATAPTTNASQEEWIKVDLKGQYDIKNVKIAWENANADSYYIMSSVSDIVPDPSNPAWTKVNYTGLANAPRNDDQNLNISGRYLAIYAYHKPTPYGYSIYELEVYGDTADIVLGQLENLDNENFNVYPNPTNSGIAKLVLPDHAKGAVIKIIDSKGVLIQQYIASEKLCIIDLGNAKKGMYLIIVEGNNLYSRKLIVE